MKLYIGKKLPKGWRARVAPHAVGNKCSPTYQSWRAMIQRCYTSYQKDYHKNATYQEQGILVYHRWVSGDGIRNGFLCFLDDMDKRPSVDHTLSRKNDAGHYVPGNVSWEIQPTTRKKKAA